MILGIVGSEGKKFTAMTEELAKVEIRRLIKQYDAKTVCSGACHLGGIDVWAIEVAKEQGLNTIEFPPEFLGWEAYKTRNIQIAATSDVVVCITIKELPESYKGMRFNLCYHCATKDHVKSGGCWTTKYARKLNKPGYTIVL